MNGYRPPPLLKPARSLHVLRPSFVFDLVEVLYGFHVVYTEVSIQMWK